MAAPALPPKPDLNQLRRQAKELLREYRRRSPDALQRIGRHHPKYSGLSESDLVVRGVALADAQLVVARECGFETWPKLKAHVESSSVADEIADASVNENANERQTLSAAQREAFSRRGIIRLDQFLPADVVSEARNEVLTVLERIGVRRDGGWCFDHDDDRAVRKTNSKLTKAVGRRRVFGALMTEQLLQAIETLLGEPPLSMLKTPQLLISAPSDATWVVPHNVWHVDLPSIPNTDIPGVQAFTFLESVKPRGGGTVAVAGSHRLLKGMNWIGSKQVKRRVKREPYFRDLMSPEVDDRDRFMRDRTPIGDTEVQVVEIHGEPGDVYLMDLRMLHAPSVNSLQTPRIMVTHRYIRQCVREAFDEQLDKLRNSHARPSTGDAASRGHG